jgi:radical SAM superfamily enzyme YgiQ (UPF0313 family)
MDSIADLCLIRPPQPNSIDDRLDPPLGLLSIAAYARAQGLRVHVADLAGIPDSQWRSLIPRSRVYGITSFTASYHLLASIIAVCRDAQRGCRIAVGGPHASALPERTRDELDTDVVVVGEGELAAVRICSEEAPLGGVVVAERITDLDGLPMPAYDLLPLASYSRLLCGQPSAGIVTSRGCPYNCMFCARSVFGRCVTFRSAEAVREEVEHLRDAYGYRHFIFHDDLFAATPSRLGTMCCQLGPLTIRFRCNVRPGQLRREELAMLRDAGCVTIGVGAETGSQRLLDAARKGVQVEQIVETSRYAHEAGLRVRLYLMVGLPGETWDTVRETLALVRTCRPDEHLLTTFVPLPGSDCWRSPDRYGVTITSENFADFYTIAGAGDGGLTVACDSYTPETLVRMRDWLKRELAAVPWSGDRQLYQSDPRIAAEREGPVASS